MDEFDNAADEIRARIETLRKKAEGARKAAATYERDAQGERDRADRLDRMANQYESLVDGYPIESFKATEVPASTITNERDLEIVLARQADVALCPRGCSRTTTDCAEAPCG